MMPPPEAPAASPQGGAASRPAQLVPRLPGNANGSALLDERALSKLHWRCRRGLLENDIFIERFFNRYEATLTVDQANGLGALMDLSDNDLLDLLLARVTLAQAQPDLNHPDVDTVLTMLKGQQP